MPDDGRSNPPKVEIWEGIYSSFEDAAADAIGPGFDGDVWRTRSLASARRCLADLRAGTPMPQFLKQRSALLPVVVAMMLATRARVRILDFGGGLGIGYMTLLESIPAAGERVSYTIVEVPQVCDEGRQLFSDAVSYWDQPRPGTAFDLVHAASSLQYAENWQDVLKFFSESRAEFMLLSDVFAGSIPTFVTLQTYYGSRIRSWFWNLEELLDVCTRVGYRLVMKTFATSRRLGVDDTLPMERFPETHRLEQSLHLLLRREE